MLRIVKETVAAVTPHVLGTGALEGLPEADPAASVEVLGRWGERGIPEFQALTALAVLALNLYALVKRGRLFHRLGFESRAALVERLCTSGSRFAGRLLFFIATPVVTAYFSRVDVQVALGFDIPSLREEAVLRRVTRNGDLQPQGESPGECSGSTGGGAGQ
ncbi:MAG: hypothetical protein FJ313_08850 [Gemmatimonadetes bacterium]|nr:hypothetical protein [Gemmatimonadota bacterium]